MSKVFLRKPFYGLEIQFFGQFSRFTFCDPFVLTLEITLYWHWQSFLFCPFILLSKVRATFVLVDQERVLDCGGDDDGDDDGGW